MGQKKADAVRDSEAKEKVPDAFRTSQTGNNPE